MVFFQPKRFSFVGRGRKKRREKSLGLSCESKSVGKSMGPSGRGRGSFVEIGPKTHCYRRVLLYDTCRIPQSFDCLLACIVQHKVQAYAATTSGCPRPNLGTEDRPLRLHYIPVHTCTMCAHAETEVIAVSCWPILTCIHVLIQRERDKKKIESNETDNHRERERQSS